MANEYRKFFLCPAPAFDCPHDPLPPAPFPSAKRVSQEETGELERTAAGEGDTSERRTVGRGRRGGERTTDGYGEIFCVPHPSPSIALTTCCSPPLTVLAQSQKLGAEPRAGGKKVNRFILVLFRKKITITVFLFLRVDREGAKRL